MIPGQNLLNMAFRLIGQQSLIYYHYLGRTQNAVGQDVPQYSDGIAIYGSFQPIPRNLYQTLGLDLQKDYWTFYSTTNLQDIGRMVSGDEIAFNGQRYQCESNNDWGQIDGWKGAIFIHIGIDTGDSQVFGFGQKPAVNTNLNLGNSNFLGGDE